MSHAPSAAGLIAELKTAIEAGTFVSLVLSGVRTSAGLPVRQDVRPVNLATGRHLQWSVREGRQERHANRSLGESLEHLAALLDSGYRNVTMRLIDAEIQGRLTRRGLWQWTRRAAAVRSPSTAHDAARRYIIPEGVPCPFLHAIGVMTAEGRVRAQQQHKFRQINRYLEFVRDVADQLPAGERLHVVDCGCGKSGLTFALRHFLVEVLQRDVHLVGLDWNAAVLEQCQGVAASLGLRDIEFRTGDIATYQPPARVQMVVSLHACDTATDAALAQAVRWQSEVILAVPCCQHELAPQLQSPGLRAMLRHGILRERFAADATDALRAATLELNGYQTQVLEFIALEHTPKNLLLRAVRRPTGLSPDLQSRLRAELEALKSAIGVPNFSLERLLTAGENLPGAVS